ncbi:MAG: thiosulfate oxidation carrier protein SoxY [Rhodobacteraceae bacterium]|jgi:sulfur-oxidizing protein SoxY|nr:thiosulfate oxidation carrier protein SoxY [Paracoccaceae bacterium]
MQVDRRKMMAGAVALALVPVGFARADTPADVAQALDAILAGRTPVDGGITLDVPRVAENGAQVPVTITVDSPMTADDHVTAIHIVATANPSPGVATFRLTPQLAQASVTTRIRLAEEQEFRVLADLSDGRVLAAAARVAVTVGGCAT